MNLEIIGISVYVLLMLVMGFYVAKRVKTDDDYFLAGRSLGPFLATFSIFATWFGAETCIGTAGNVYREGLSSIHADPLGYAACIILMGLFFSKVLWKKKITTIPDLFRERFSPNTEKLAALIMIPSSIIWAGAQIRAFGQIIHSTTDYGFTIAVTVAALVVIIYTISGGMLADAYTDLIQGFALIAGLLFLLIAIIYDMGGIEKSFSTIDLSRLNVFGGKEEVGFFGKLELWMVPIMGSLMAQELVSRVVASKSETVAMNSCYRAGALYLMVGFIPVLIGLLGVNYLPNLHDSETIMPLLAKTHLSYFFYIIFVGALVSAILSTVDSTLLSASALLSHNIIYPSFKNLTERQKVLVARSGVFISGLIAYGIAFTSDSITGLVELASSLGGPSILVIALIALYVKRGDSTNAMIAICVSIITWASGHFVFEMEFPVLLTVAMCALSYFVSSLFTKRSHEYLR
jgi:solute:Na+ symporter, SSS family